MRFWVIFLAVVGLAGAARAGEINEHLFGTVFTKHQDVSGEIHPIPKHHRVHRNLVHLKSTKSTLNENLAGTIFSSKGTPNFDNHPISHHRHVVSRRTIVRSHANKKPAWSIATNAPLNEIPFGPLLPVSYATHTKAPLRVKPRAISHHAVEVARRNKPRYMAPPATPKLWNWTGFYIGGHVGYGLGLNNIADPFGASIFGDKIRSQGFFGGAQLGYNWQIPNSKFVLGMEASASWADLDGTNTCYAASGTFTSFNCRGHTDAFGTLTGRVGWAFGPNDRILAYVKGGGAWAHGNVDTVINSNVAGVAGIASTNTNRWGWTVGIGAEYAMRLHWSVTAEYDYMDFGDANVAAPSPSVNTVANANLIPTTTLISVPGTAASQQVHVFKLGMNYKFGPDGPPYPSGSMAPMAWATHGADGWSVGWPLEVGIRYWYSSGRFQKDIGTNVGPTVPSQNPTLNISRLTWDNLTGKTGEIFARLDTPLGWFVKGFIGGGNISGGHINDEDWGLPAAVNTGYSNTVGDASGNLRYGTIDLGYNVFSGAGYKVGFFTGYNYYRDKKSSYSCTQIALPASGICSPSISGFVLSENDTWQSARLGGNAEIMLSPRWKLSADVAVLPYVKFKGQDDHPLRPLVFNESGTGVGTQAELFLNGYLTPQLSLGVGGRYWAMWTNTGSSCVDSFCPYFVQNAQYKTERYGVLFQAAYKWDQTGRPSSSWVQ